MPVGDAPMAYLNDVAVTYVDGEETKTVSSAAEMLGKALTVNCSLANLGANDQPYTVFAAVYNQAGKLIDIAGAEGTVAVGGKETVTVTGLDLTGVTEDCVMKILAWDRSNNTQIPLTTVYIPF